MISIKTLTGLISKYKDLRNAKETCLDKCILIPCTSLRDCVFVGKSKHQSRIPTAVLKDAFKKLSSAKIASRKFADFEELYDTVKKLLRPVKGIGDTTIYQVAIRIGNFLFTPPIVPNKYVYLHGELKRAARNLLGGKSRLPFRVEKTLFPKELQKLSSAEIEDFLCTFRKELLSI